MMRRGLVVLTAVLLSGCTPENDVFRQSFTDTFYQEPSANVDTLWVVDNSISMIQEQAELAERFNEFISSMDQSGEGIDFHIGVVTTDMDQDNAGRAVMVTTATNATPYISRDTPNYLQEFQARVQVGTSGSDMEKGMEAAFYALTEPMISDANNGFLRDDALLSIIFVSDENDCSDFGSLPADSTGESCYQKELQDDLIAIKDVVDLYRDLKSDSSDLTVSSIVGPEVEASCDDTVNGSRYRALAGAFGGIEGNICDQDFTGIMEDLGVSASGIRNAFGLSYPAVAETIEVYVDETQVLADATNGWTYDASTYYITFADAAIPPRDSVIVVNYEIATAGTDTGSP